MGQRRSKEEAAAAKAEYLKQKAIRDQVRAEKKAKREQMAKERLERKAAREKRRQMTEGERAKAKKEAGSERKRRRGEEKTWYDLLPVFEGTVEVGKTYTVKFAGGLQVGTLTEVKKVKDMGDEQQVRPGTEDLVYYWITNEERGRTWHHPVHREDFIAEGHWYRNSEE